MWEVFSGDRRVRTSVPKGARDAWSRCPISALADVITHRDIKSWTDLLTLLALVLPAPSRGGRRNVLRYESEVRRRCLDWLSGIRADLWAPPSSRHGKSRAPPPPADDDGILPASTVARVSTLIQEGALRRACAALLQDPPVRPTEDVVASQGLLHPGIPDEDRVEMTSLRRVALGAAPSADSDQVRKALWSFSSTSGAGRSSLRPSHVRDAMRPASSDLLLRLLSEVVSILLRGEVPEEIRPYVCGASIMALRKPNGTLRPIAIGETIRRLASKVAVDLITERAREIFEPLQLGVRTPNGCEAIIHVARQWFSRNHSDTGKVAITVDVANAFSIPSTGLLSCGLCAFTSRLSPPGLTAVTVVIALCLPAPVTRPCRSSPVPGGCSRATPSVLSFSLWRLTLPLLRPALLLRPFLGGIDICSFFLDDGFCAGSAPAVRCFLSALTVGFRRVGLTVNLDKTEVIPACLSSQTFDRSDFQGCSWCGSGNFKLLGAPIKSGE